MLISIQAVDDWLTMEELVVETILVNNTSECLFNF